MNKSTSSGLASRWTEVPPDFRCGEGNQEHYPLVDGLPPADQGDDALQGIS